MRAILKSSKKRLTDYATEYPNSGDLSPDGSSQHVDSPLEAALRQQRDDERALRQELAEMAERDWYEWRGWKYDVIAAAKKGEARLAARRAAIRADVPGAAKLPGAMFSYGRGDVHHWLLIDPERWPERQLLR